MGQSTAPWITEQLVKPIERKKFPIDNGNFISDKTPSVYPKKYGLYNLISGLEKQLLNKSVSVETGVFIKDFEIKDNKINIVKVETKNGIVNYESIKRNLRNRKRVNIVI